MRLRFAFLRSLFVNALEDKVLQVKGIEKNYSMILNLLIDNQSSSIDRVSFFFPKLMANNDIYEDKNDLKKKTIVLVSRANERNGKHFSTRLMLFATGKRFR